MNDFVQMEKAIVREMSCRLCLCTDVIKLKPLSAELKRKIKRLFDITIRSDDSLPKAICHDCLQQVNLLHLYSVKVEKTQQFLDFHHTKLQMERTRAGSPIKRPPHPVTLVKSIHNLQSSQNDNAHKPNAQPPTEVYQQGDVKEKAKPVPKKRTLAEMKFMESMPLEEFANSEKLDKSLLGSSATANKKPNKKEDKKKEVISSVSEDCSEDVLDHVVIVDGRPAKQGAALDKQITLFYKMECNICHERGFNFRALMKHYKERHGVPGYVTCCDKKFHYFYPKKIIEHMAFHLQPNIFMCKSCHQCFQTSMELNDHQANGGRSEGKIMCPRCSERYPTFRELGWHIITHRSDKLQCDYCAKLLKHHHRKKTVNHMEQVILCSQCIRNLKNIEKQERELKERIKSKPRDSATVQKLQRFKQALGVSGDDDESTD